MFITVHPPGATMFIHSFSGYAHSRTPPTRSVRDPTGNDTGGHVGRVYRYRTHHNYQLTHTCYMATAIRKRSTSRHLPGHLHPAECFRQSAPREYSRRSRPLHYLCPSTAISSMSSGNVDAAALSALRSRSASCWMRMAATSILPDCPASFSSVSKNHCVSPPGQKLALFLQPLVDAGVASLQKQPAPNPKDPDIMYLVLIRTGGSASAACGPSVLGKALKNELPFRAARPNTLSALTTVTSAHQTR